MQEKLTDNDMVATKRSVYILPNLFTTAGLFAGFYAIVAAMKGAVVGGNGHFEIAAIAIFIAMIMDGLDGRVARLTGTQSMFGAHYDSLSDMVCFGVTPALVAYSWGLHSLGKLGWIAAFFYTAATALRLARFNLNNSGKLVDSRYFTGIPCPAAAGVVAGMVWIGTDFEISGTRISEWVATVMVFVGFLMISNLKFYSFKEVDFKGAVPFVAVPLIVIAYLLVAWDPPKVLFAVFGVYALSGIVLWLLDFKNCRKSKCIKD